MKIKRGLLYKDTYTCLSSVANKIKVVIPGANVNKIPLENQTALRMKELLTCVGIPDSKDIAVKAFRNGKWRLLLSYTTQALGSGKIGSLLLDWGLLGSEESGARVEGRRYRRIL